MIQLESIPNLIKKKFFRKLIGNIRKVGNSIKWMKKTIARLLLI